MENGLGRHDIAEELWEKALAIARSLGDKRAVAVLLHRMSHIAIARRDFPLVRTLAEESLEGHRAAGFPKGEAQALSSLAVAARAEGDLEGALELLHESGRIAQAVGFRWWLAGVLANIGAVSLELGRLGDARRSAHAGTGTFGGDARPQSRCVRTHLACGDQRDRRRSSARRTALGGGGIRTGTDTWPAGYTGVPSRSVS